MKLICIYLLFLITFCSVNSCKKNEYKDIDCNEINASFAMDIFPIIQNNCLASGCHNAGSSNGDLTTYIKISGKVNSGNLEKRVLVKKDMPKNKPLSLEDRKKIKCWLENGAQNN